MKEIFPRFILRWVANTLGLWIASQLIAQVNFGDDVKVLLISSFILSIINALIKPVLVVLSLPFIVLSLGLFTVVVNGAVVWLVSVFYNEFTIGSFTNAVLAGLIIGLVNYLVTIILDRE